MASVFKKKGTRSGYWYAAYTDDRGQRVHRSTKQTNKTEATALALAWDRAARAGRDRTMTETQARKILSEIVERTTGQSMQFYTCRTWMAEFVEAKRGSLAGSTFGRYKQQLDDFLEHLGKRADAPLAAITSTDIRKFRDFLFRGNRSARSVNMMMMGAISGSFNRALRNGLILVNPCIGVDALSAERNAVREPFTEDQVRALLRHADNDWQGMILVGYFTGLRLSDCARLRWEMIDIENTRLTITPSKTRFKSSAIVIPLHPDVMAWLRKQARGIGKAPVFPELHGRGTHGTKGLSYLFSKVMIAAQVQGRGVQGKGRKTNSLSFHSLRHSFVSTLANAGIAPELRRKLSGHSTESAHAIYTHHEVDRLRKAVETLPSVSGLG